RHRPVAARDHRAARARPDRICGPMRLAAALLFVVSTAHADRIRDYEHAQGVAWLHYELTGLTQVDDRAHAATVTDLVLAGARIHGFFGFGRTIGYHAGLDLAAGGTIERGGFAYDVALFPVGIAARAGSTSFIAFGAGIAATGATNSLDDAVSL